MFVCCPHCEWRNPVKDRREAGTFYAAHSEAHVLAFRRELDRFGPDGFTYCAKCVGRPAGHRPCYHVSCMCSCSPGARC